MDEVFQCVSPSICLESGNHAVASIKNSWIFLENKKKNPVISASCPYSIYDHVIEMLCSGIKINNAYYYCRGCKKIKMKSIAPKCSKCQSDVKRCQAWLVAALSGGFHELYTGLSSKISSTKDPRSQQKTWLNKLLGKLLTFLIQGQTYSHGEHWPAEGPARDYLDSVYSLNQEDIMKLTPITLSMEETSEDVNCNSSETSELQNCESWNLNNNFSSISENTESRMSEDLILSANDSDLGILQ